MKRNVVQAARIRDWDEVQRLIEQGGNVNDEDERRRTALHYAVLLGKRRDCAFLLSRGANVSQTDVDGCQPLHLAASGNCSDICKLLIDHSADVTAVNTNGDTPLLIALDSFQSSALYRSLVTNESVNIADRLGNHALHKAISKGYIHSDVLLLVEGGADVNAVNKDGQTPLHTAAGGEEDCPELCSILLKHKAKVNAVDKDGNAPLHLACKERHSFTANLLFSHGADVNALNKQLKEPVLLANESIHKPFIAHDESMKDYGDDLYRAAQNGDISVFQYRNRKSDLNVSNRTKDTLLHAAAGGWKDCPDLCSMLLGLGARLNAVDGDGNQPLHLACRRGHTKSSNVLLSWGADAVALNIARQTPLHTAAGGWKDCPELCSILVEHKAKINAVDKDDNQPLHLACQKGHTKCSAFLLSSGVDANALNENRQTPLHIVVSNLSELSVLCSVLLQYKAKIDAVDEDGNQPLHLACEKHHTEISRLLLSKGANASAVNGMGQTPLHIVVGNRSELSELCSLLLRHNAKTDAVDEDGNQPLHLACKRRHTEISRLLLSKEANASAVNKKGQTPLHIVVCNRSELSELCSLLLQHNAKIDAVDKYGNQPLHLACKWHHTEISRLLLSKGANASAVNVMGETPLHIVVSKSSELSELCSLLLQHNAKIDTVDKDGNQPLHLACKRRHTEISRLLLSKEANASAVNKKGQTPLHIVVCNRSELSELCSLLLQHNAKIDAVDKYGNQPLHLACKWHHTEISRLLLSKGANASAVNVMGETPLHIVVSKSSELSELCSLLLQHNAKIDTVDKDGNQPLHLACKCRHTEISQLLLSKNGANASAVNGMGQTPLHIVVGSRPELSELCSLLLQHNAKIDAVDKDGNQPLHLACKRHHTEISRLLLSNGANASAVNVMGQTPLHIVVSKSSELSKLCSLLLQHNAKIDAVDKDGNQPLHLACELHHTEICRLLLSNGANASAVNKKGLTPLHIVVDECSELSELCSLLLQYKAKIDAVDEDGNQPLHLACAQGHIATSLLLLSNGANANAVNEKGQTPLHTAAGGWKDCSQLCSILLEHEAKIDAVDKDGNQPLHFACEHHHTEISQLLLSNGANASAVNKKGLTPLHIVCKLSELSELCSSLVEQKAKIDAVDKDSNQPLHLACEQDHIEASLLLLSNGENANSLNADGQTPLHTAADGLKDCHKLCSNLVEHKAKIDAVDKDGNQPLHLACESGLVTTVKHLLDCNVDVFATNKFHQTALHKAACSNRDCPTISVMLIAKGAHVNATDGNGNTSLQVAYQKGNSKTVEVLIESDSDRKILNVRSTGEYKVLQTDGYCV